MTEETKGAQAPTPGPLSVLAFHCESARLIASLRTEAERIGKGIPTDEPGFHKDIWTAAEIIEKAEAAFAFTQKVDALAPPAPVEANTSGLEVVAWRRVDPNGKTATTDRPNTLYVWKASRRNIDDLVTAASAQVRIDAVNACAQEEADKLASLATDAQIIAASWIDRATAAEARADRLAEIARGGPTCQVCGSKIEAWTCQGCGAQFHENDAGSLVLALPAAPTGAK